MDEYIEREAAHRMVAGLVRYSWKSPISTERHVTVDADDVNFGLDKIPAAEVAPVVHGKWLYVHKGDWTTTVKCSECGRRVTVNSGGGNILNMYPYCHCGAKMEQE